MQQRVSWGSLLGFVSVGLLLCRFLLQFWLKFAPMLDSSKAWRQKADEAETGDTGRDRLQDLSPDERQAARALIEEERRRRSHIVSKYLNGMQVQPQHQQQKQQKTL